MTTLKLAAVFVLFSAAVLSGCTVCVDCEPPPARKKPLGRVGTTYYYSEKWTEPSRSVSTDSVSYASDSEIISTPVATSSYQPTYWPSAVEPVWRGTSRPVAATYPSYSSSYYPTSSYYYQYQRPAVNRQYAWWPYTSPPELPSAEWQARFIGRQPRTMYYYPPVNSFKNSGNSGARRRSWNTSPPISSGGSNPVYLGPVWYYP